MIEYVFTRWPYWSRRRIWNPHLMTIHLTILLEGFIGIIVMHLVFPLIYKGEEVRILKIFTVRLFWSVHTYNSIWFYLLVNWNNERDDLWCVKPPVWPIFVYFFLFAVSYQKVNISNLSHCVILKCPKTTNKLYWT